MAEAIARHIASRPPFDAMGVRAISAGASAVDGLPATPEAVTAVDSLGMEMHEHRSAPLSRELIAEADAIYGLTPSHVQAVLAFEPSAADRVHLLDPEGRAVPDPIGYPQGVYDETAQALQRAIVDRLSEHLSATRQSS